MQNHLSTYTDSELLALAHSDASLCDAVFSEVYDRHSKRMYAYALRVTGRGDDANDLMQECFIRFYHAFRKTAIDNCGGYLMRTIRNLCLNHKRDTKLHEEYSDDMTGEQLNANLEEKDLLAAVAKGLQRVSFDLREVFVLRYYHSMEYEEIAAITGESINTVRTRVWRAKEKLKHILLPIIREVNE